MKRVEAESLGDVLRRSIEEDNLGERLQEVRAASLWRPIVGPVIADQSGKPTVRRGLMTVCVRSATLRHDLLMSRSTLVKLINEALGAEIIKDIRFIG